MLEKLAAKKLDPKDIKNPDTKTKTLSEAKQEIAKMRAASKRLAAAGKQRQGARQASGGQGANSQGADGEMGEGAGETSKTLEDLMAELDDAAAEAGNDHDHSGRFNRAGGVPGPDMPGDQSAREQSRPGGKSNISEKLSHVFILTLAVSV